jgi:CO/xanthine dehydrogenase FAD-binding subunit
MRSFVPVYDMVTPRDIDDALARLPEWRPFAGGTDLMVLFEAGKLRHTRFMNIWPLAELKGIDVAPDYVTLGALTTYTEVQRHAVLRREFPMLCRAAAETGGIAIQNRGTLGGNIVNASPAADAPPALLAYGAEVELTSRGGSRWIAYDGFHIGYKQMDMQADELLTRIRLPRDQADDAVHYYRKVGTRKAQAISKICFVGYARRENGSVKEVRIALGSVAPTVIRCRRAEALVMGHPVDGGILDDISPIDDMRSTLEYRARVTANLMEEFRSQL